MKYSKPARVLAWLGILIIISLIIYFLINAFTGNTNFMGSLYLVVTIPVIIWAILFFAGFFRGKNYDEDAENDDKKNKQDDK